jgi:hypothetical protein
VILRGLAVKNLCALASIALLAACTTQAETDKTLSLLGHVMAFEQGPDKKPGKVLDRSGTANTATVTTKMVDGKPSTVSISVAGTLQGGTAVPGATGLKVDQAKSGDATLVTTEGADGDPFLAALTIGKHHAVGFYATQQGTTQFIGVGVTGETATAMPTAGAATFKGDLNAIVAGSVTGVQSAGGPVTMTAAFAPGGGTISGRTNNLADNETDELVGFDFVFANAAISGTNYSGGTVSLVSEGLSIPVGTVTSSNYQGSFFGPSAVETGGTFQIESTGVPNKINGGTQTIQAIGAFGASQ